MDLREKLEALDQQCNEKQTALVQAAIDKEIRALRKRREVITVRFGNGTYLIQVDGRSWMPMSFTHGELDRELQDLADLCDLALEFEIYDLEDSE